MRSYRWWLALGAIALVYLGAARIGLDLPVAHGVVTPVWIPTGISVVAAVLLGLRVWPAIAAGAFLANLISGVGPGVAAAIAVGNTGEAVLAALMLRRAGFDPDLDRVKDIFALVVLGGLVAPTVSATVGISSLIFGGRLTPDRFASEWMLWWFGDVMGAVLVAPAVFAWAAAIRDRARVQRPLEAVLLTLSLGAVSAWVFLGGSWKYPYLLFPLLVWAALRFRQLGGATAILLVSVIAVVGTLEGSVPIGGVTAVQSVQILQALLGVVGVSTLLIGATLAERGSVESELVRRERLNESLLSALSDLGEGFLMTDAGRLTYANEAYCKMTGYTLEELMALPSLLELSPPEERQILTERLRSRLAGGQVEDHYEATLIRKDGRPASCEVAVKLMATEEGPRLVSIVRDVTDRKRMEIFRDEFLAYAAHELRGPISTIRGFTELLAKRGSYEEADIDRAAERIAANAQTMSIRLERLMSLARVQRGDLELHPTRFNLLDVVRSAAYEVTVPENKTLRIEVPDDAFAISDRHVAEQIMANLLTNAFRYGGDNVVVTATDDGDRIELAVADDGRGVPEGLRGRLFQPFAQGPDSKRSGGAGLGLAMVRALADNCGLETGYRPGDPGACFYVIFPTGEPG
ncbi:MAG: MASE1 domain-containing protein [Actinomycetota bacterium]